MFLKATRRYRFCLQSDGAMIFMFLFLPKVVTSKLSNTKHDSVNSVPRFFLNVQFLMQLLTNCHFTCLCIDTKMGLHSLGTSKDGY
jgi:hypothetical protein